MQRVLCANGFSSRRSLRVFRPCSAKYFGVLRRSRVIGAHSGICRLRMDPSEHAAVNSCVVAWRCGNVRSSRSSPTHARRAVRARRNRYDAGIFSTGLSRVYVDGVWRLEHAFVDAAVLDRSPPLGNAPDSKDRLIQALCKIMVLSVRIPQTRRPAVRC